MKTLFATLALALSTTSVSAQNYDFLTFQNNDNTTKSLSVDGLKITFENGNAIATVGGKSETFALDNLKKLYFTEKDVTGIKQVVSSDDQINVTAENGHLIISAPEGSHVAVYSLDGRRVGDENLAKGVYVVRVNDRSFKIYVK